MKEFPRIRIWPDRLDKQLALLAAMLLALTIIMFTLHTMQSEAQQISDSIKQEAVVLTKNIATTGSGYLFSTYYKPLEELLLQSASYPGVNDLLVCDPDGTVIRQVQREPGKTPYLSTATSSLLPPDSQALRVIETDESIVVWYPVISGILQGWVRIKYGLETVQMIQKRRIIANSIVGLLGIAFTVLMMITFMRKPLQHIEAAAKYAKLLDSNERESFPISNSAKELRELGEALNTASQRLHEKDVAIIKTLKDLKDQKFALDQHSILSISDTKGNIFYANDKFCELTKYSLSELVGKNYRIFNSGVHHNNFYAAIWNTVKRGDVWHGEICNKDKDGDIFWVETTIVPFLDADKNPYQYMTIQTNITNIKYAEQTILESRERLRRSQEAAQVGSWDWDMKTNTIYWSEQVFKLYGMEIEGDSISFEKFINKVYPQDRGYVQRSIELCMKYDSNFDIEHRIIHADGSVRWIYEAGEVVKDDNNAPQRMLGIAQDITERKVAEIRLLEYRDHLQEMVDQKTQDLVIARDEALAAERSMSTFLANMSHELRTPLHGILSFANFGISKLDRASKDKIEQYFNEVRESGQNLLNLVNNLLDLSKLRAGKMSYHYAESDMKKVVEAVIRELSLVADEKQLNFIINLHGDKRKIVMDEERIAQVLRNLLSNAIKFSATGGDITVTVTYLNGERVEVCVDDEGMGVPDEELEYIFNAFIQSSKTVSSAGGTGLGLPICKEIVEKGHDGWINAANRRAGGAVFKFNIPNRQ